MTLDIEKLYNLYLNSRSISTDTRKIMPGSLFFALKGERFNGNTFARHAIEAGASYAVVDEAEYATDDKYILVENVLQALQQLANYHRRQLTIPFIGITGSNGKTTTKELINAVLSRKYKTYATKGNLNNHIGVPLTILAITNEIEMAIIEMGANKIGDVAELVAICEPTHGLITNIGKAHLEGFGGVEGVKKGKGELYDFLQFRNGVVFVNALNETLESMVRTRYFGEVVQYPRVGDFMACEMLSSSPFVTYRSENGDIVETHLSGVHNFENIAVALCVGKYFEVSAEEANVAVSGYISENNRSQIVHKGTNIIYLDAYNANPTSMQASLEHFMTINTPKKVVILGDMFELGEESETEHRRIGEVVAKGNFSKVLLCGKRMQAAVEANPQSYYFIDKFSLNNWLQENKIENAHILIKGSRGMGLETIVDLI
ncbi:UDP-N-acetylmuramoyl-tripeptide--D-alanyl-D-alanine ligase [Rhodocytophaga rosea]|uniref:UDP-N-acetylmuramoyl-tripeptide--D-alanyl-D-alanine ligase n=1 Tax=Rhodocytophaga rosea TaxID=2704465 RepID=A0A6C0GE87_9BACT|nr:UDP-N-acetylmuramoyl-tripeptide--D-alanyl-D-alanine ligase [Rhodocytophaga rosea]QHT66319.1 UDP-N-acetylmuramoyl-tripeptide--D-alanyl-D-alanine ligase [Rhodocytophaga rosea]